MARNTATRDRHRSVIARAKPPCAICGADIDYTLRYPDPGSFVVDHIVPVYHGGGDELDNKQAAHNTCNRAKWHHASDPDAPRTFVTDRHWW